MTSGETTYYQLPFPYGDEPMSLVDDYIKQLAEKIDLLLHNAATAGTVAYRLYWSGNLPLSALTDYDVAYQQALDQTNGTGLIPEYSLSAGIVIPSTGLWHIEVWNRYDNNNAVDVPVLLDSTLLVDGVIVRTTTVAHYGDPGGYYVMMSTPWTGWAEEGDIVRGRARTSKASVTLVESVVRLVGPLNVGAGFLGDVTP